MRPTSALLAGSMLLGFTAQASSHLYIGDGANSCGAWTQERAQDSQRVQLWKGWVLGFVSGIFPTNIQIFSNRWTRQRSMLGLTTTVDRTLSIMFLMRL